MENVLQQNESYTDYIDCYDPEPVYSSIGKRDGWIAVILLASIIFGPRTDAGASLPPMRFSDIIIFFLIISRWIKTRKLYGGFVFSRRIKLFSVFMVSLAGVLFFSTFVNAANGRYPFFIKDYFITLVFIRGILVAAIVASLHFSEKQIRQFVTGILVLTSLAAVLSFVQKFIPHLLAGVVQRYYAVEYEDVAIKTTGTLSRVVGTMGNANLWGALQVVLGCVSISAFLNVKGILKIISFGVYILMVMSVIITTASRSGVIALLAVSGLSVILSLKGHGKIWVLLGGILLIIMFFFVRNNVDSLPINPRMQDMLRGEETIHRGLANRFGVWARSLDAVKGSFIMGTGASRSVYQLSDNGYIMTLLRTGLIGLGVYLAMLSALFIRGFKAIIIVKGSYMQAMILMPLMVLVAHVLYEVVADFFYQVDYMAMVAFFLGLLCSMSRESLDERDQSAYYYEGVEEVQMA